MSSGIKQKLQAASNPTTPVEILKILAKSEVEFFRGQMAKNAAEKSVI